MSLTIYLDVDPCPHCGRADETWSANYTHNVAPMWRLAGCYEALYESHGRLAREVTPALVDAVCFMASHPDECRAHDSPNGWGTYANAYPWLSRVLRAFQARPDAVIRVSR